MPRDDDETTDDTTNDDSSNDNSNDNSDTSGAAPSKADATDAVASATPEQDDAHRGMLGEVLNVLDGQGIDVNQLAQQYGLPHMDVDNMSAGQLVQLTQKLAQEHPDIVAQVSQQFPAAQGLLGMLTGGGQGGGGGMLGGLLGRFL